MHSIKSCPPGSVGSEAVRVGMSPGGGLRKFWVGERWGALVTGPLWHGIRRREPYPPRRGRYSLYSCRLPVARGLYPPAWERTEKFTASAFIHKLHTCTYILIGEMPDLPILIETADGK